MRKKRQKWWTAAAPSKSHTAATCQDTTSWQVGTLDSPAAMWRPTTNDSMCKNSENTCWDDSLTGVLSSLALNNQNANSNYNHIMPRAKGTPLEIDYTPLVPRMKNPDIYVVATTKDSDRAVDLLCASMHSNNLKMLSFDIECTAGRTSEPNLPSIIQLATFDICVLFQVYRCTRILGQSFPPKLAALLATPFPYKIGIGATQDADSLQRAYSISCYHVVDICPLLSALSQPASLASFCEAYAPPQYHDKAKYLTRYALWQSEYAYRDWDVAQLDTASLIYASKDVFGFLFAFREFFRRDLATILARTTFFTLSFTDSDSEDSFVL
jgi:hypothetical protein